MGTPSDMLPHLPQQIAALLVVLDLGAHRRDGDGELVHMPSPEDHEAETVPTFKLVPLVDLVQTLRTRPTVVPLFIPRPLDLPAQKRREV